METDYTDNTPMPFGQHRNTALANVPAEYLLWLYSEGIKNDKKLVKYIQDNMQVLKKEANR